MQQWVAEDRNKDSRIKCLFSIRNWRDENGPDANELSGWTRATRGTEEYAATLDHIPRLDQMAAGPEASAQPTELRTCDETELMEKLPRVHLRGACWSARRRTTLTRNEVVIAGTALLMKDSFKIYRLVNDGIIRLIDLFEMTKLNDESPGRVQESHEPRRGAGARVPQRQRVSSETKFPHREPARELSRPWRSTPSPPLGRRRRAERRPGPSGRARRHPPPRDADRRRRRRREGGAGAAAARAARARPRPRPAPPPRRPP